MKTFQLGATHLPYHLLNLTRRSRGGGASRPKSLLPIYGLAALWLLASPDMGGAAVVYDDTSGPGVFTEAGEVGDTVTLAGTERYVTGISIGVVGNGHQPVSDDYFQMRLWTADGPGGTAGTLLWQSPSLNIPLDGPLQMISFEVPSVHVPDTLIFDVSHTDVASVFFEWSNPVTVGSSPDYAWIYLNTQLPPYYGTPANFMARIEAAVVPEPSALALLGLGAVLYRMRICRNKDRQGDDKVSNPSIQRTGASRFRSVTISEPWAAGSGR